MINSHLMPEPQDDGRPPFLGTWRRVYTATMVYLAVVILAFYAFTRSYR
jgi:hypothetical protein